MDAAQDEAAAAVKEPADEHEKGADGLDSQEPVKKDAFKELMRPKRPVPAGAEGQQQALKRLRAAHGGRYALGMFTADPAAFASASGSPVVYYNDGFVAVRDQYPKSAVHLLLLPRSPRHQLAHPLAALSSDAAFLASVRAEAATLRRAAASELRRLHGAESAADRARNQALDGGGEEDQDQDQDQDQTRPGMLPAGRDWEAAIKVGVHAVPSMAHLHVHVISVDGVGRAMKKPKHYQSFNTPFFVSLDEFPLPESDPRREAAGAARITDGPLVCWRCGQSFGRQFEKLKRHLKDEFDQWKRE